MYRVVQFCVNKAQNGYVTPSEFNLVINQAQLSYANFLIGQFQSYQYGRNQSRVSFGNNENVRQSLTPIIYQYVLSIAGSGLAYYPGDYQKMDALTDIYGTTPIRWTGQDKTTAYITSSIDPIATNPAYELVYNGFKFYPSTLAQANLSYVKRPPDIVWGYILDANGEPTYDSLTSVDPVWFDVDCLEISVRALKMIGVNLQAADVYRFAEEVKTNGQ
jgi:hypothetical protein